jgi:PRTRC genetic system protein C
VARIVNNSDNQQEEGESTVEVEKLVREFCYNGVRLADPNPRLTIDEVRNLYAAAYPDNTTAAIEGPEALGSKLVYRFVRAIGAKG